MSRRPRGTVSSASGVTGADGRFTTTYTASEIAGMEEIIAGSPQAAEEVKARIAVKVEGLVTLPTGPHYELVGAPQNHAGTNDPCRVPPPTSQHSRNHYGTAALITAIQNIARAYASLHPGVRLRINDMSLEFGGLFDNLNNWQYVRGRSHGEHRVGKNANIAFSGIDSNNRCVTRLRLALLRQLMLHHTTDVPYEHTGQDGHFHIRMR